MLSGFGYRAWRVGVEELLAADHPEQLELLGGVGAFKRPGASTWREGR